LSASASRLHAVADEIAKSLVSIHLGENAAVISLPMLFPGGAPVTVFIEPRGDRWLVHDNGAGALEAEMMGALASYRRTSHDIAKKREIAFDHRMFFLAEVGTDWLASMVVAIGEAARDAVMRTAEKVADGLVTPYRQVMLDGLVRKFGAKAVSENAMLHGGSTREHKVDAIVASGHGLIAFDLVTSHSNSIAATFTKFSDLSDAEIVPERVAVLSDRERIGSSNIILLGKAANVIMDVPTLDASLARLAA
jgi:hypothetical protein